jgi:biotin synthase-related radical SAM superfamily protein
MEGLKVLSPQEVERLQTSPEYVRVSVAAAMTLGLKTGRMYRDAVCRCVNLLLHYPQGCWANCTYCGLARERPGVPVGNTFIRVTWPLYPTDLVVDRIAAAGDRVGRVCIAQVQDKRAYPDLLDIAVRIRRKSDVPISALVSATLLNEERLRAIQDAGADIIGIGLDAASEEVFYYTRGRGARGPHDWRQHWEIVGIARRLFGPFKVNCHVIVGLGETDRDLVELFYRLKEMEVAAYLFSFNPEPGTAMGDRPRAPLHRWRRVQLVKYLIEQYDLPRTALGFDAEGNLVRLSAPAGLVERALREGTAFMTNGCPDRHGELACNRPFGSYRPGEEFRDYPFKPTPDDLALVRQELQLDGLLS